MQKLALSLMLMIAAVNAATEVVAFEDNWASNPLFNIVSQTSWGCEFVFSMHQMVIEEQELDGTLMNAYGVPAVFLPRPGAPNINGASRYLAVPKGAQVQVTIIDSRKEIRRGIEVPPVPEYPLESDEPPLTYQRDMEIYGTNAFYPASPVIISDARTIRGVDMVLLTVMPFQYNPVSKELVLHKDIRFRIDFVGGTGRFGEDRLRSRFWEPILQNHLLNYGSLPEIDFYAPERLNARDGWEYVIIVPDDPVFEAWADTIKAWRKLQGISCEIFTLTEVGGSSASAIESFLNTAYSTWSTPPAAFLLLSDYPSSGDLYGIISPVWNGYCVSDNIYADYNADNLPDMHHGRICAQSEAQLSRIINKFLSYERQPYTSAPFYDNPLVACGWQDDRWFQLASEVVRGFLINELGKSPSREYNVGAGSPYAGSPWSTRTGTGPVVAYWNAYGYVPLTNPYDYAWWDSGSAAGINTAINSGAFFIQHRDHGATWGWSEPNYDMTDLDGLTNTEYTFVNSTNCETGHYNYYSEVFAEKFYRMEHGAWGANAASEVSYSFVNDTYIWGMWDCLYPDFDPGYPTLDLTGQDDLRPCMAMTSGKIYLHAMWFPDSVPGVGTYRVYTDHLFHHHGDCFTTLYSEIPQYLNVVHAPVHPAGVTIFAISADSGSVIGLTVSGEIIGVAEGTGATMNITIPPQTPGTTIRVTVTKANHYRYDTDVLVTTNTTPYVMVISDIIDDLAGGNNDGIANPGETIDYGIWAKNVGGDTAFAVYGLLSLTDPYLTMNTDSSWYGDINENDSSLSSPYYEFDIASNCPNGHVMNFELEFHDLPDSIFTSHPSITVYAPIVVYQGYQILDANSLLEPGEVVDLAITLANEGGAAAENVTATITTDDVYLTILTDTASYGGILPDSAVACLTPYVVEADSSTPVPHVAQVVMSIAGTGYAAVDTFGVLIGNIGFYDTVEDTMVTNQYTVQGQWHRTQHRNHSPSYAWWNGTEGTWVYSNNVDASIITPLITLGDNSEFECWNWYYLESNYDYGYIELSTDNGTTWSQLTSFNGNSGNWVRYSTTLNYPVGTQVKIRFRLDTDYSVVYEGWYVDDIRVFDPLGVTEVTGLVATEVSEFFRISPNPFKRVSAISYQLARASRVALSVYDVSGRLVKALSVGQELIEPGYYTVSWDGSDEQGRAVPAGVYFVKFESADHASVQKAILLR